MQALAHKLRQLTVQLLQKPLVRLCCCCMALLVDLLKQREATPLQGKAGADHLHTAIGLEIAPVHQNDWLHALGKHLPCHAGVDVGTLTLQGSVAKQPIHALDSVAYAGTRLQGACQIGEGMTARV